MAIVLLGAIAPHFAVAASDNQPLQDLLSPPYSLLHWRGFSR
ncbi:MAG: hypothetical protein ACR2PV_05125 [Gammaproteobacteria bacterium]